MWHYNVYVLNIWLLLFLNMVCGWFVYFFIGMPSGVYRSQWLNALRGYSSDLDWSVDNKNVQHEMTLDNIYTRMKENWEYRGSKEESRVLWNFQKQPRPAVEKQDSANEDAHIKRFVQTWVYSIGPLAQHGGAHPRSEEDRACECVAGGEEMRQESLHLWTVWRGGSS